MKTRLITLLSLLFIFICVTTAYAGQEEPCGFDEKKQWLLENDPEYAKTLQDNEDHLRGFFKLRDGDDGSLLTVPIVVHIIHLGENDETNISNEQVQSAIDSLNKHYSNVDSTHGYNDTNIRFCLAIRGPDGGAHSGINRVDGTTVLSYATQGIIGDQYVGGNETEVKALSRWPNTDYYNIWIVSEINNNDGGAGTQGYAYSPGAGEAVDGAVILYNAFGTTGTLKPYTSMNVTTTHEVGHGLNLLHPFEGLSCDEDDCETEGDMVCDTPPQTNNDITCDIRECSDTEHIENYMDYADEDCQDEFSTDQTTRMRAALLELRPTLIASDACVSLPPNSDFSAPSPICTGDVPFTDLSNNGPTGWKWEFLMGNINGMSFDQNPVIPYNTAGDYDVALTATNSIGTGNRELKKGYVKVYDTPPPACEADSDTPSGALGIFNVTFNTIDNDTSIHPEDLGYKDFTCSLITRVVPGSSYTISVTTGEATVTPQGGDPYTAYEDVHVYIDYNNNSDYEEESELAFSSYDAQTIHTGTIDIPSTAINHQILRMRVVSDLSFDGSPLPLTACDNQVHGQAEDYGVIITPLGDVDLDRDTDLTDAMLVLMSLAGLTPEEIKNIDADINGDGKLDMAEVLFIMQWVGGLR
jgi:PKD repeat protein